MVRVGRIAVCVRQQSPVHCKIHGLRPRQINVHRCLRLPFGGRLLEMREPDGVAIRVRVRVGLGVRVRMRERLLAPVPLREI